MSPTLGTEAAENVHSFTPTKKELQITFMKQGESAPFFRKEAEAWSIREALTLSTVRRVSA